MWQTTVLSALSEIEGVETFFIYPDAEPSGTYITFSELGNSASSIADNLEYATEIIVKLDIWDMNPLKIAKITLPVILVMRGLGFEREYCLDLYEKESKLHHKTMRFKGVLYNERNY